MNEKLQYASMLEMPMTTCSVNFKPIKKKKVIKKKDLSPEAVKQEVLDKVNESAEKKEETSETAVVVKESLPQDKLTAKKEENKESAVVSKKEKKVFKPSFITIQLALVVLLVGVIAITNILNPNSGINVFMKSLFVKETQVSADNREFNEFEPVINFDDEITLLENGVLSMTGSGSVYSPCDGTVASVSKMEDGSYSLEISHSEKFSTLITGLTYAYMVKGEKVYANIPVGYMQDYNTTLCFLGADGAIITGYELLDGAVVWAV